MDLVLFFVYLVLSLPLASHGFSVSHRGHLSFSLHPPRLADEAATARRTAMATVIADSNRRSTSKTIVIMMATKDGKKKKRARADVLDSPVGAGSAQTASAPKRRVNHNINIPMRQQIAWAKAYKRLMSASSAGNKQVVSKAFKKDRGPKEPEEEYVEIDYVNTKPPAIFVDGYNIIGYINSVEGRDIEMSDARDCLISDLAVLRGATGWWIELVFDAYSDSSPTTATQRASIDSVFVTYTSRSETADNHIERRFAELKEEGFTNMVVATDDKVLQMVAGASGSGYITASMLLEELRVAYRGWEEVEVETKKVADRHRPTLGDGVSSDIRDAIAKLKAQQREAAVSKGSNGSKY
jgi:predicted RNA-binding protein with PIN domain